jgi:DNA polymerase-3 subunit alpha
LLPERAGLEPADVTKICEDIDSSDYIEIELENGKKYKFDKDAQFLVKRGDETLSVYADELQEEDDIVFDRKNELFDL